MTHAEKVSAIAGQLKNAIKTGLAINITKKSVSHLVPDSTAKKTPGQDVYIGELTEIIEVDKNNKTCVAESGVTFSDLVNETLKYGLVPYVVPELKGITIGGAISGCSIETMSYRYGGFHDNCLEYEIITADGGIINCSPENVPDVFNMIHGSYGTLGILTKIKFKLYSAKPFVKMTYAKFSNFEDYWNFLCERFEKEDYELIDGIIHNKNQFTACLGNFIEQAPYVSSYEQSIPYYISTLEKDEDYLATGEYFFRYDADCHWLLRPFPLLETKFVRKLFGKYFLGSTNMIRWSARLKKLISLKKRPDVIVDVFIPSKKFPEFYKWYENDFDFYPLWIVPYRMPQIYPWVAKEQAAKTDENFYIDCAIYGKKNNRPEVDYSELLENKVFDLGGVKTLISRNHYCEEKFWRIYNKNNYDAIKQKTDPQNIFGTVYNKLCRKKI